MENRSTGFRICIIVVIVMMIAAVSLVIGRLFFGNPFSRIKADISVKKALDIKYNDMGLIIEDTVYDYECGNYVVNVKSRISKDTHFSFYCNKSGQIKTDDYKSSVLEHDNTWFRVNRQYSEYVYNLIEQKLDYSFYNLEPSVIYDDRSKLQLDKEYDVHDSTLRGEVSAYIYTDKVTWDNLAEITKKIDETLRRDGIVIDKYSITIGTKSDMTNTIGVDDFNSELLSSDNLPEVMKSFMQEYICRQSDEE